MEAGNQKDQIIGSLEFSAPSPILERRKGLHMELAFDHTYVREPP